MSVRCLQISLLRNLILYLTAFDINKKMELEWVLPWVKIYHLMFVFNGFYTHFESFLPSIHNFGMTRQSKKSLINDLS